MVCIFYLHSIAHLGTRSFGGEKSFRYCIVGCHKACRWCVIENIFSTPTGVRHGCGARHHFRDVARPAGWGGLFSAETTSVDDRRGTASYAAGV